MLGFKLNSGSIHAKTVKKRRMLTCNVLKYPFWINRGKSERSLQFSALYFKECDKVQKWPGLMESLNQCQMRFLAEGAGVVEDMISFSNAGKFAL